MNDVFTVIWKEWRDLTGDLRRKPLVYKLAALLIPLAMGVMLPLASQGDWATGGMSYIYWIGVPFVFITQMVADSFAGERERHTLETLLASRLPDHAIYFGKLLTPVVVIWGLVQLWMLYTLIPLNIAYGQDGLLIFDLDTLALGMGASFVLCLVMSASGTLASLHAPTVQTAQVRMGMFSFVLMMLPMLGVVFLLVLPSAQQQAFIDTLKPVGGEGIILIITVIALVLSAITIWIGVRQFHRNSLILD